MDKITITFAAGTIFGKGDSTEWDFDYEVTQKQYERMISSFNEGESFDESEKVHDIFEEVYEAAVNQATADLLEYNYDMIEEYIDEDDPDSWRADDIYEIRVNYPYEWDELNEVDEG